MCLALFSYTCTVGETSDTTVGSTTGVSSATTVPPMHSPTQDISSLPSTYQAPQLQQQPTPSQLQPPGMNILYHCRRVQAVLEVLLMWMKFMTPCDWFVGDQVPREEVHILLDTFSEEDGGPGMCMGVYSHLSVLTCTELISMHSHMIAALDLYSMSTLVIKCM